LELSSEQLAVGRRPGGIEATGWLHLLLISGSVETLRQRSSKLHAGVGSSSVTMTIGPALMADFDWARMSESSLLLSNGLSRAWQPLGR
jgi:hypothetical protein